MIPALYLHIPFCHSICPFCAFAVHGDRRDLHRPYLDALARELGRQSREFDGASQPVRSVYVGGGTPSTLALDEWAGLLEAMRRAFGIGPDAEIAVECNPEDVTADYARGLLALGTTRISLGVQSLDDASLKRLGRGHDASQARAAFEALREAGTANVNVDLMFGAPDTPPEVFQYDVDAVLAWRPEHVSLYGLDIEEGTPFGRDAAVRDWSVRHRDRQAESYVWAARRLTESGYRHYEVSNFALPGREGRQNLLVWDGANYLGIGTGAHSFVGGARWHHHRHLKAFQAAVDAGEAPIAHREVLGAGQRANEALMLALRRAQGLDVSVWSKTHAVPWDDRRLRVTEGLVRAGLGSWDGRHLRLTAQGFLVADEIAERLMVES